MKNQSVFNFVSQNVYPVNMKPTAFCCADNKLMVAFDAPHCCIEVYDLQDNAKVVVTLKPFSHCIHQMLFCREGNYIATFGRNNESPTVSVIFNWWLQDQPFVYRTAGTDLRFTEFSSLTTGPEVVTIPLDEINMLNLRYISCCESSGNLVLCYGLLVSVFKFQKTVLENQTSKPDFNHILNIRLSFIAYKAKMCEDFMAFTSLNHVQVIRLFVENDGTKCVEKSGRSFDECIEWNVNSETSTVRIPSICCESADESMGLLSHHPEMMGPMSSDLGCKVKTIVGAVNCKVNMKHEMLLCRYMYENECIDSESDIIDVCLVPVYKATTKICKDPLKEELSCDDFANSNPFNSKIYSQLLSCGCFVSTKNFGYLYSLKDKVEIIHRFGYEENAKSVAVEETVVHVLTDNSLRTYSLSLLNSTFDLTSNTVPLLLNSRLFLGTEQLLNSTAHVLLISRNFSENNSYTVYSLEKPSFEDLYKDINEFCDQQLSNQTYISDQVDMLHFLLVQIRLLDITSVYSCNERQKRHFKICFSLTIRLEEHLKHTPLDSIVKYVYKCAQIDLKHVLLPQIEEGKEAVISEVIRLKSPQIFKLIDCDQETLFKLLSICTSEDVAIIIAIIFNYKFGIEDKQRVMSCVQKIHSKEQGLLEAKICFDCNETEEVRNWLISENESQLSELLASNYNLFLPLTPFSAFIAAEKTEMFINCCILCLNNDYFSALELMKCLTESQELMVLFLDAVFCSMNSVLDSSLVTQLTIGYMDSILRKSNVFTTRMRSQMKLKQKCVFLQLLLPIHTNSEQCVCSSCCPEYEKLNYLLYLMRFDEAIEVVSEKLKSPEAQHLKMLQIFVLDYNETLQLIYELNADAILPFTLDPRNTFKEKWKYLFENIVEKMFTPQDNENTVIHDIFLNLSESLTPREFIDLIPPKWTSIAKNYFKKCLQKHESQILKDKIVNLGNELKTMITLT